MMAKRTVTRLKRITLAEISLVDRPACDKATVNRIEVAKRMGGDIITSEDRGALRKFLGFLFPEVKPEQIAKATETLDIGKVNYLFALSELELPLIEKDSKDGEYGAVEYADSGYQADKKPRYPVDTEEHIRAAWNYIGKEKNAAKYSAEDLKKVKAKIVAAWKAKIDKDGPPSAADDKSDKALTSDQLVKSLWDVAGLAQLLMQLHYMVQCLVAEQFDEGDASEATNQLIAIRDGLGEALVALASEEVSELTEAKMAEATNKLEEVAGQMKSLLEQFQKGELPGFDKKLSKEQAAAAQDTHDHLAAMGFGPHASADDAEKLDAKGNVEKQGRYSKADKEHGDLAHDASGKLGATCAANKADAANDVVKLRTEMEGSQAAIRQEMATGFATLAEELKKALAAPNGIPVSTALPPGITAVDRSSLQSPAGGVPGAPPAAITKTEITDAKEMTAVITKAHGRQGRPLSEVLH